MTVDVVFIAGDCQDLASSTHNNTTTIEELGSYFNNTPRSSLDVPPPLEPTTPPVAQNLTPQIVSLTPLYPT